MRPGGEISKRFLDLFWIVDKSASMNENGKISSLNTACREALPFVKGVQQENPGALLRMNVMSFGHGAEWITKEPVPIDKFNWQEVIADTQPKGYPNRDLEIIFMVDTSGSMSGEIEAVKTSCVDFANHIEKEGLNTKLGLVGFDIGGCRSNDSNFKIHNLSAYTIGICGLTSPKQFKENIKGLFVGIFGGAGCYLANIDTVDIFPHVVKSYGQTGAKRILVVISDEIGTDQGLTQITNILKEASVITYVLGVSSGTAHKQIADKTGGEFWDINKNSGRQDFSKLLTGKVAETIAREAKKTLSDGTVSLGTDMGAAMNLMTKRIGVKSMPERCLPPVAVLVSDGQPTDNFKDSIARFMEEQWAKKMVRLAIAIGEDCDLSVLQQFIGNYEIKPLKASNTAQLVRYFKWASTVVLRRVSNPSNENSGNVVQVPRFVDTVPETEKGIAKW